MIDTKNKLNNKKTIQQYRSEVEADFKRRLFAIIKNKKGKFLGPKNVHRSSEDIKLKCKNNHVWVTKATYITTGRWCYECARLKFGASQRLKINDLREIALKRGGKLLSKKYINSNNKIEFECKYKHKWLALAPNIKKGGWCPKCAGKARLTIEDLQKSAALKNGVCLSQTPPRPKKNAKWKCHAGHIFYASTSNVRGGKWCPYCTGRYKKIEYFQQLAAERKGKCLSKFYKNSKTKLIWECIYGHRWESIPISIQRGGWCPTCSTGLGERLTRVTFERLFGRKFNKVRPTWLTSPNGYPMELDGYNKSLGLAFEHQGKQHSKVINFFDSSKKNFAKRLNYDKQKINLCAKHSVVLILVPEVGSEIMLKHLKEYVIQKCELAGINVPVKAKLRPINYGDAYIGESASRINELKDVAEKRGGALLTKSYLGSRSNHNWACQYNHTWWNTADNVKRGQWCPYCSGNKDLKTIYDAKLDAKKLGGRLISKKYSGPRVKLKYICKEGHIFRRVPAEVALGRFCSICTRKQAGIKRRHSIDDISKIAVKRGGRCLSRSYNSYEEKLDWICSKNHKWSASLASVKNGSWCPACALKKRTTRKV